VAWATILTYAEVLRRAFDMEVINDTSFYRTSRYDNMFVCGAVVGQVGMIDVMSELGSWQAPPNAVVNPQPGFAPNPWNAAARAQLGPLGPQTYRYNNIVYTITPALADAEEAAVFFDPFISDHLPVAVEVQVPAPGSTPSTSTSSLT
jgi:hypothetical protein